MRNRAEIYYISAVDANALIIRLPAILLALTIHELSHGLTAYKLGDSTARDAGRLTLNPIAHLDLIGTVMLISGLFGWAKPVPVNPCNLRNPKRDLMLISLAGPLSNIVLALCSGFALRALAPFAAANPELAATLPFEYLRMFLTLAFLINSGLAFFNLLPLYPLDGSKILAWFLPDKHIEGYMRATRYALPAIFALAIIGAFTKINILSMILSPVFMPFMRLMRFAVFWGDGDVL